MRYLFVYCFLFIFISCSEDKDFPDSPSEEKQNPYKTGIELSSSETINCDNKGMSDNYFMLGYGFDVTGKYAHPAWVRNKILDIDKYQEIRGGGVTLFNALSSEAKIISSGTKEEYLNQLARLAGFGETEIAKYKNLFSATLATTFAKDTSFSTLNYYYSGYSSTGVSYLARFMYSDYFKKKYMQECLTNEFKTDLKSLSPNDVLKKYGTHLLREVFVGRRIDYLYRANTSDFGSWDGYNAYYYLNIPNSALTVYKPTTTPPQKENVYIEIVDGTPPSPNAWMFDITNGKGEFATYKGWVNTTDSNLSLVYFSDKALVPIYELVDDDIKKEELYQAYEKYLGK